MTIDVHIHARDRVELQAWLLQLLGLPVEPTPVPTPVPEPVPELDEPPVQAQAPDKDKPKRGRGRPRKVEVAQDEAELTQDGAELAQDEPELTQDEAEPTQEQANPFAEEAADAAPRDPKVDWGLALELLRAVYDRPGAAKAVNAVLTHYGVSKFTQIPKTSGTELLFKARALDEEFPPA